MIINRSPDAVASATNVPSVEAPKVDPVKFVATLGDTTVKVYERTQERGRGVGKKTFSPNLESINQDNYTKIFPVTEFWENLVRPALRRTAQLVTEETVTRDTKNPIAAKQTDILSFDQDKWINMFFGKVSAVSESLKGLRAQKDDLFAKLVAMCPPDATNPQVMAEFTALAQALKDINTEIEEKSA